MTFLEALAVFDRPDVGRAVVATISRPTMGHSRLSFFIDGDDGQRYLFWVCQHGVPLPIPPCQCGRYSAEVSLEDMAATDWVVDVLPLPTAKARPSLNLC